ncbi:MAG: hypothetical protein C4309_11560, partial [Chloroflexota bacterium]
VRAYEVGMAAVVLGAGRARKGEPIDPAVGVIVHHKVGDAVRRGEPLFTVHANDEGRLAEAEAWLAGKTLDEVVVKRAGELALRAARPIDDVRATAEYRRAMVRVTTERALRALRDGAERADWPDRPVMLWGHTEGRFPTGPGPLTAHRVDGDEAIVT